MTETSVLETAGRYRVRLEVQQDSESSNPRTSQDCNLANVITPTQRRYIKVDENGGPFQYAWEHFSNHKDSVDLFRRWARIVHGVTVVEDRPNDGAWSLWYVMPDKAAETPVTPEKIIEDEIREYRLWAEGEVYGHIIEESVRWQRCETTEDESMITWEEVDSCWGYIGRQYAEEEARQSFVPYAMEVQA